MTGYWDRVKRVLTRDEHGRSVTDGGVTAGTPTGGEKANVGRESTSDDGDDPLRGDGPTTGDGSDGDGSDGDGPATGDGSGGLEAASTFDALGVPAFVLGLDGTVVAWNESLAELTGTDAEDAIGHAHVSELFYPDGRRADTLADKVLEEPDRADEVYDVTRRDTARTRYGDASTMVDSRGQTKHIEFTATPLYADGALAGVTEVVIDRTKTVEERDTTAQLVAAVRDTAVAIGDGDLNARAAEPPGSTRLDDELVGVVDAVNEMADGLQTLVESVHEQVRRMDETTEEASGAVDEIAENVAAQDELLDESVTEMQSFSAGMEEVAATADQVDAAAEAASDAASAGLDASEDARAATEDVVRIGDELVESVGALSDRMTDIEEVIAVISEVAEQTNLLALNANIEAARAGEGGDGFAVVAEEVKKLADETRGYTEEITASLDQLRAQSAETSGAVERSHDRIRDAETEIETVLDALTEIADAVDEAAVGVGEVARATDDQAATVEQLTASLERVRDRSDRTETATTRIVDATQRQTAAVDELVTRVERLDGGATDGPEG